MTAQPSSEWERVASIVGRSLAYLCLQNSDKNAGTLLEKSKFLMGLGLSQSDAAEMLGSSAKSLSVLARRAKNEKRGKSGKEAKAKRGS
jgi:hypothetical protein